MRDDTDGKAGRVLSARSSVERWWSLVAMVTHEPPPSVESSIAVLFAPDSMR